jgi:hypothetical protein
MSNIEEMLGQVIAMMAEDKSNDWSDDIGTIETAIEEIRAYQSRSPRFTGRLVIDSEKMRDFLEAAWIDGWNTGEGHDRKEFWVWYLDNYDDIIEAGTEAPASEKMSVKEEILHNYGNSVKHYEMDFLPYDGDWENRQD